MTIVTLSQISDLGDEALAHGDVRTHALVLRALAGSERAVARATKMILAQRAEAAYQAMAARCRELG